MRRVQVLIGLTSVLAATAALTMPGAEASNSPTFRDCSFLVEGFDPDFVQLSGVTATGNTLTVSKSQAEGVQVEASESSDPGDDMGHVTLTVTVTAAHGRPQTVSGAAVDKVFLAVPLQAVRGRTYTINWAATFDNGGHVCPSSMTPDNTQPNPFVVTVT